MKHHLLKTTLALALFSTPAFADNQEDLARVLQELEAMKSRISLLESELVKAKAEIVASSKITQSSPVSENNATWADRLTFSGAVELEAMHSDGYNGNDSSDLQVATVELGVEARINTFTTASVTALYEEDEGGLDIDTAFITFANAEQSAFSLQAGQLYVPFGQFETAMVNDTLLLEIAETRETAAVLGWEKGDFSLAFYAFNGDVDHDSMSNDVVHNFGGRMTYYRENFGVGVDYTNNLADSDAISDTLSNFTGATGPLTDNLEAHSLHAYLALGNTRLVGEVLSTGGFSRTDLATINADAGMIAAGAFAQQAPEAWQLEVSHTMNAFDRDWTAALSAQETDDARFLGLPEKRHALSLGTEIADNLQLSVEYFRDSDYPVSKGGSGEKSNNLLLQLATGF